MTDHGASTTITMPLLNPRTGAIRGELAVPDRAGIDEVVGRSRDAAKRWAGLTTGERARRLRAFADLISEQAEALVRAECAGTGKPAPEAAGEVASAADVMHFFAGAARADVVPASGNLLPERESWVRWEPLGTVAAIVPWNYPLMMAAWRLGPALASGNAVVLKPAETTPDSALLLMEYAAATLGTDVLLTVPGTRETGRLLVESQVDAVAFTGSVAGGLDVAQRAGVRRVSLELGGNCPAVVLPDAPADTYQQLAAAATYNAGQSCAAPARVITLAENYAEVVDRLSEAMAARQAGRDFGPLNSPQQFDRFTGLVGGSAAARRAEGNRSVQAPDAPAGFWVAATVLADVEETDPVVAEEVFGPCLTVQSTRDLEDAVRLANGVPQALAGSVWTEHVGSSMALARGLDTGEVWVNCVLDQTAELPHGGRRQSGHGTDMSTLALAEYQRPKTVTVRVGR